MDCLFVMTIEEHAEDVCISFYMHLQTLNRKQFISVFLSTHQLGAEGAPQRRDTVTVGGALCRQQEGKIETLIGLKTDRSF